MTRRRMLIAALALTVPLSAQTAVVGYKNLTQSITAATAASVPDPTRAVVESHLAGWVERVLVATPYQQVTAGEPLCIVYSPELMAAEQDYLAARAYRDQLAASPVTRVAASAARVLEAARQRLDQAQVPAAEQARLLRTGVASARLTLTAPESAVVLSRAAVPQLRVQSGAVLYTLAGLDPIWIYAQVPEAQLASVATGGTATLTWDSYPGETTIGHVAEIEPAVDAATRTVPVRIVVANPGRRILPGMTGTATLQRALGRRLAIPADAVLHTGTADLAFVDQGNGQFARRPLRLGPRVGEDYVVLNGVRAGDRVSTAANFLLDANAQLSSAAGNFAPPPPGVGVNTAPAPATATLALTTAPTPARSGVNQVRVRLTSAAGAPVPGARVSATFFMPAMPAMGMAEMKYTVAFADRGGGMYEGQVTLGSGGVWQVTVTASAGGRVLASLHTTVRATGGM